MTKHEATGDGRTAETARPADRSGNSGRARTSRSPLRAVAVGAAFCRIVDERNLPRVR
ncbi:MAG TPA: hypothetical protein VFF06_29665 [Polyangia bacterium]|nr:hypothetical protein [Polyangia bacterium]